MTISPFYEPQDITVLLQQREVLQRETLHSKTHLKALEQLNFQIRVLQYLRQLQASAPSCRVSPSQVAPSSKTRSLLISER